MMYGSGKITAGLAMRRRRTSTSIDKLSSLREGNGRWLTLRGSMAPSHAPLPQGMCRDIVGVAAGHIFILTFLLDCLITCDIYIDPHLNDCDA